MCLGASVRRRRRSPSGRQSSTTGAGCDGGGSSSRQRQLRRHPSSTVEDNSGDIPAAPRPNWMADAGRLAGRCGGRSPPIGIACRSPVRENRLSKFVATPNLMPPGTALNCVLSNCKYLDTCTLHFSTLHTLGLYEMAIKYKSLN